MQSSYHEMIKVSNGYFRLPIVDNLPLIASDKNMV